MGKVGTKIIETYQKDIQKEFRVNLMYNSRLKFHIEIPIEFEEVVLHISRADLMSMGIENILVSKAEKKYKHYVVAETESQCMEQTKKCLEYMIDKSIIQRDVIIVFYNPKDNVQYGNIVHNAEHPQIGLQFGLTYAVETSVGENNKVYSIYPKEGWRNGCILQNRKELNLWGKICTVIPDTLENRMTLEQLYNAFMQLNKKLTEFTKTPDALLDFIQSNVKLLN